MMDVLRYESLPLRFSSGAAIGFGEGSGCKKKTVMDRKFDSLSRMRLSISMNSRASKQVRGAGRCSGVLAAVYQALAPAQLHAAGLLYYEIL